MKKEYLECAIIINTHGIKGDVKLESLCDSPKVLASLKRVFTMSHGQYVERQVLHASVFKNFVIMSIDGVNDIDTAEGMKGSKLYAKREDFRLPEGSYFIADLEGLDVIDIDSNNIVGKIKEVISRGAHDIYVVDTKNGERMIPVVDEFVKKVDLEVGVYIHTIPGLIED